MNQQQRDEDLWAAATQGDSEAFGELFDRHADTVANHCFRRTADWASAEDVTSLVFLHAWRRRMDASPDEVLPWLLAVANNLLRNHARSLRRFGDLVARLAPATHAVSDPSDEIAGRIDDERLMRQVLAEVRRLPTALREVLELVVWDELTYEQAALALNVPIGTVRSRMSRARKRLKHVPRPEQLFAAPAGTRQIVAHSESE